jgi:hypothetical protein
MKIAVVTLVCICLLSCRKNDSPQNSIGANMHFSSGRSFAASFTDTQVTVRRSMESYGELLSICGNKNGASYLCIGIINPHVGVFDLPMGPEGNYVNYFGPGFTNPTFIYSNLYGGYGEVKIEALNDKLVKGSFYVVGYGARTDETVDIKNGYFEVRMK